MIYNNINLDSAPCPAFAMAIYTTGVEFGTFNNRGFSFDNIQNFKDLTELHIFNNDKEYRFMKLKLLNYNVLIEDKNYIDKNYIDEYYIDEYMLFFGEKFISNTNKKTVLIDKGNKKDFFLNIPKKDFEKGLFLKVRNYLNYGENGMVRVCNYRLAGLYVGKEREEFRLNEPVERE